MSKQATVVEQKQLFLQSRKQLLSRGIPPSERLRTIAEDGGIELSVLKGVLDKVNRDLKQHSRKVYSRQMIEHVVEQIDTLYWESGAQPNDEEESHEADSTTDDLQDSTTLYQADDLSLDINIAKLPTVFPTSSQPTSSTPITQDAYLTSLTKLQSLSAHRQTLENRLNTYRTLLSLLEPYRTPKENIQPNLVWRDAPLQPGLGKMRTLAIRVAGRVEEKLGGDGDVLVPATAEGEEEDEGFMDGEEDVDMRDLGNDGRNKLEKILATW